ncbi:MAG: AAA family ATPase [Holosporaceae bacterium]|jgi:ATP-dependent Clp protease ATP-binding subunit ClpA|nr:AAA family ATPase [Holosporaceae bacterium]
MRISDLRYKAYEYLQSASDTASCIVLNVQLPSVCTQSACRIGFEKHGETGSGKVLIDRNIDYRGSNEIFRNFLRDGEFTFRNSNDLNAFLTDLSAVEDENLNTANVQPPHPPIDIDTVVNIESIVPRSIRRPFKFDREGFLSNLQSEIRGQRNVLQQLAHMLYAHTSKSSPERPLSILFAGRSGVGKTKTASLISALLNRHTQNRWGFIRVDMNQLNAEHTVSRLIGAPPGYLGYRDIPLFEALLHNPWQIILFDEMEKAHPKVLQVLMNAMGEGRLESSCSFEDGNRSFDFRRCVMLFTTNIPFNVDISQNPSQCEITRQCRNQLCKRFNGTYTMLPEVANRFTEILLFNPLNDADKIEILALSIIRLGLQYGLEVKKISESLLQDFSDKFSLDNGVRDIEYMLESYFGSVFSTFIDKNHDKFEVFLSGKIDNIEIKSMDGR